MKKKRIMTSFPVRILAVSIPGLLAGLFFNATRTMGFTSGALNLVVTTRYVLSQLIAFLAPLIIIGLMASSIISVKKDPHASHQTCDPHYLYFHAGGGCVFGGAWIPDHPKASGFHRQLVLPLFAGHPV